jgi:hypothetical protein
MTFANRSDLLQQIAETRMEAEDESINVLKFGLESKYSIAGCRSDSTSAPVTNFPVQPLTISFVAIDPYPHHVIALVRLMEKAILRKYLQGNIKQEAYLYLLTTLRKVSRTASPEFQGRPFSEGQFARIT